MVSAYILINIGGNKTKNVIQKISKIEGVKNAHAVTGPYDLIVFVSSKDLGKLANTVCSKIRAIDGVKNTITCVTVEL